MAKKKETQAKTAAAGKAKKQTAPKKTAAKPRANAAQQKKGRGKTAAKDTAAQLRISRDVMALAASVLAALLIALSVRAFGFGFAVVRSDAMEGTLLPGDIVLISRSAQPEAGNIVLAGAMNGSAFRRIAGEPGDTVKAVHGEVFRNGMEMYEPYATGEMLWQIPERTLEDDVYLLLPDNRAYDSALIRRGGISGVVRAVVWPIGRAGFF